MLWKEKKKQKNYYEVKILSSIFNVPIEYKEIKSLNGSIFSKLINLIYFLDYITIYHALLNNTDPSPVKSIEFIKTRL